jgi:predicted GIY-YIG superfamily endonuclease
MEGALRSSPQASGGGLSRTASEDRIVYYTYVLESLKRPGTRYIGRTSNLQRRLEQHNTGGNRSTARHRPWKLKLYIAFETRDLARNFERYLKSGSGHAFANRHFWI